MSNLNKHESEIIANFNIILKVFLCFFFRNRSLPPIPRGKTLTLERQGRSADTRSKLGERALPQRPASRMCNPEENVHAVIPDRVTKVTSYHEILTETGLAENTHQYEGINPASEIPCLSRTEQRGLRADKDSSSTENDYLEPRSLKTDDNN